MAKGRGGDKGGRVDQERFTVEKEGEGKKRVEKVIESG